MGMWFRVLELRCFELQGSGCCVCLGLGPLGKGLHTIWVLVPKATGKIWRAQTEWPWFLLDISGFLDAMEAVCRTVDHSETWSPKTNDSNAE